MENENLKCVIIVDENIPLGIIANTTAILGITIGQQIPSIVGPTVYDGSNQPHLGIVMVPVPILKSDSTKLLEIRKKLYMEEFKDLTVVDFSDIAQCCLTYDNYIEKSASVAGDDYKYFGIALYGNKKKINKLSGSLPLLR